ncbi:MAG TPA: hypothetical protein DIW80_13830 [Gordonia polyisoprenivorans]|nr:hypothetical protein [Gordonia polyisoprenivorans]
MGTALFSVILTNELKDKESVTIAGAVQAAGDDQGAVAAVLEQFGLSPAQLDAVLAQVPADMADAFATVFVVATILVACCLIPAFFLPRKPADQPADPTTLISH